MRNNSPLEVVAGATTNGYVAYYANEVMTTLVAGNKISSNTLLVGNGTIRLVNVKNQKLSLYNLVGSAGKRHLVTRAIDGNKGFDLDYNLSIQRLLNNKYNDEKKMKTLFIINHFKQFHP